MSDENGTNGNGHFWAKWAERVGIPAALLTAVLAGNWMMAGRGWADHEKKVEDVHVAITDHAAEMKVARAGYERLVDMHKDIVDNQKRVISILQQICTEKKFSNNHSSQGCFQ